MLDLEAKADARDHLRDYLVAGLRGQRPEGHARAYEGLTLAQVEVLCRAAERLPRDVVLTGGRSDFPIIMADALSKRLMDLYQTARPTGRLLTREVTLADFRPSNLLLVGTLPPLERVAEHAEFKQGVLEETGEVLTLATYGRILGLSRQAIVNDDVGALQRIAEEALEAVLALETRLLFASLTSGTGSNGPTLRDGVQFFDAAHANLASAAALDIASLAAAVALLRKQTTAGGEPANLAQRFLLVTPDDEMTALGLVTDLTPPGKKPLEVVVDASLASGFYVVADPRRRPGFVRGTLGGRGIPTVVSRQGFAFDGLEFQVKFDVGIGPADPRSWVRTPAP